MHTAGNICIAIFTLLSAVALQASESESTGSDIGSSGMVWIPAGTFMMGSPESDALARPVEKPSHSVTVNSFWMDRTEVTNDQFAEFVEETGYVTVAERDIDWNELKKQLPPGTPRPAEAQLAAGSTVFTPPDHPVPIDDIRGWWSWVTGAEWRHPEGPGSDLTGRGDHPVVHVAWEDASAYAQWAGKRLPTEAEWEYAARGGLGGAVFTWGNEPFSEKMPQANIWQGAFPHENTKADGYVRTAPVKTYAANGYGLYDMSGNVWEWCADWWRYDLYGNRAEGSSPIVNPQGPARHSDPRYRHEKQRVTRGGSFLCHDCYCAAYRPAGRRGTAYDTGLSHVGFRCVKSAE